MFKIDKDDMFQLESQNENLVTKYIRRLIQESDEVDPRVIIDRVKQECRGDTSQVEHIRSKLKQYKGVPTYQRHYNSWFVGPEERFKLKKERGKYLFSHNEDFYKNLYYYQDKEKESKSERAQREQQETHLSKTFSKLEHTAFVKHYLSHLKANDLRVPQILNKTFREEFRMSRQTANYRRTSRV